MLYKQYKIILKYYQANVLESTYNVQRIISNEKELEFIFGRNQQAEGVFQEFADTFIFIKEDRDYIIDKRNDYLARKDRGTYLQLEFHALNRDTITYDIEYSGKLKFEETVIENLYANCPFTVDTAFNRLNAIQEDIVSIEKDGIEYDYEVSLNAVYDATSEVYYKNDNKKFTGALSPGVSIGNTINPEVLTANSESSIYEDYSQFRNTSGHPIMTITPREGCEKIKFINDSVNVDLSFSLDLPNESDYTLTNCTISLFYGVYSNNVFVSSGTLATKAIQDIVAGTLESATISNISDVTIDFEIVRDDENVENWTRVLYGYTFTADIAPSLVLNYEMDINVGSLGFTMDFGTQVKTSKIVATPLREILDDYETIQGLTINTDALDGTIYDVNNILLSTSRGIKGITPLTYQFSFQKWFNSSKAFQALSFSYVGDTIYILPILDAYDDSQTKELPEALSLEISENNKGFNLLTVGNSGGGSSNFTYEDLDPLAQATYDLGLETEQEKKFSNDIRVDGSTINKAAIDYEKVTTDIAGRDDDKDLYFIARKIGEPTVVSQFTLINGVDFQKFGQAINMEYSKSRQLYNWRNYYGHLITGVSEFELKSWDKNKDLVYTDTDRGINVIDTPNSISECKSFNSAYADSNNAYIRIPVSEFTRIEIEYKSTDNKYVLASGTSAQYIGATTVDSFYDHLSGTPTYSNIPSDHSVYTKLIIDNIDSSLWEHLDIAGYAQYSSSFALDGNIRSIKVFNGSTNVCNIDFEYINGTTLYDSSGNDNHATINGTLAGFIKEDTTEQSSRDRDGYGINAGVIVPRKNTPANIALPKQQQVDIFDNKLAVIACGGIFGNDKYTAEIPQKSGLYQFIKANPNIKYTIPFKGEYYTGYIDKVALNPLIREVITIELTQSK